jgi:hypothetical protein
MRSTPAIGLAFIACAVLISASAAAEQRPPTSQPNQPTRKPALGSRDVQCWAHCDLDDGRRFITDGGLLIEARYFPKVAVPERAVPGKNAERLLQSKTEREFGLDDLSKSGPDGHYRAPDSVMLNRKYIELLRDSSLAKTLRFRAKGNDDPVLLLDEKKVVGVVMPVKQASERKGAATKE